MGENENARMRVVVRIRPINQKELRNEEETILEQLDEKVKTFFLFFKFKIFHNFTFFFIIHFLIVKFQIINCVVRL